MAPTSRPFSLLNKTTAALRRKGARVLVSPLHGARLRLPRLEHCLAQHGHRLALESRPLTSAEIAAAKTIFDRSLDYDAIRIVKSRFPSTATTLGNVVRIYRPLSKATLIHELMHVWQYQHRGTAYISNSVCHQLASIVEHGHRGGAYRLTGDDVEQAVCLDDLTAEQQAVLVEKWFRNESLAFRRAESRSGQALQLVCNVREIERCQYLLAEIQAARPLISKSHNR